MDPSNPISLPQNSKTQSSLSLLLLPNQSLVTGYTRKPVSEFVSINALDCDSKLYLDFLPGPVQIEASTKQGILLCMKSSETRNLGVPEYFVCKPSTKQWQQIPNPKTWYKTKRCAIVVLRSNPLHYKIVWFSEPKFSGIRDNSCYSLWCEIFDSATWTWKKLEDTVRFPEYEFLRLEPAVTVCGSFYWLMTNNQCSSNVFNMQSYPIEIHPLEVFPFQSDLEPVSLKINDGAVMPSWVDIHQLPVTAAPILWSPGMADRTVLFEAGHAGPHFLVEVGVSCEFKAYPGLGHSIINKDLQYLESWIKTCIPGSS
ncbi:hypothetical protein SO802_007310 [Lithocarpus litseifolius]|uniref:F-box associated beta-propeller type 1 domain-containing protein n=1 Tax=Lithocarpus litseifolius TaxID=425828 RepID=A0AAW2DN83_9ROSI